MKTLHLDMSHPLVRDIANALGYKGRKVKVRVEEDVALVGTYWDGGSRSRYYAIDLATMRQVAMPQFNPPQFGGPPTTPVVPLADGLAIVEWSIFCGKDAGLTIHLSSKNLNPSLLESPADLTPDERAVLTITAREKASYNGMNRQQRSGLPLPTWNAARETLTARGLLNKAGAITPAGRNALGDRY